MRAGGTAFGRRPVLRLPQSIRRTILLLAVAASANAASALDYACSNTCAPPDCLCPSTEPPGGLTPADTPQMILLTFDDTLNTARYDLVQGVLTNHWNPNGSPMQATFFLNTDWSDYWLIRHLRDQGHEIAIHTMTHTTRTNTSEETWRAEIAGCRKMLADLCGIPCGEIVGFRAPYLEFNNASFRVAREQGLLYDASVIEMPGDLSADGEHYIWPYTLDTGLAQQNRTGSYQPECFPGLFEIPLWDLLDTNGYAACSMDPTGTYEVVLNLLKTNFTRRYEGNRAPLGIFLHAKWLTNSVYNNALNDFLTWAEAMFPDVWMVTMSDLIAFMRDPQNSTDALAFEPFAAPAYPPLASGCCMRCSYTTGAFNAVGDHCPLAYPRPDTVYVRETAASNGILAIDITGLYSTSFWGNIVVSNNTASPAINWEVRLDLAGGRVHRVADGTFVEEGDTFVFRPAAWMRPLDPGETETVGFGGSRTNTLLFPTNESLALLELAPMQPGLAARADPSRVVLEWSDSAYGYALEKKTADPSASWQPWQTIHGRTSWTCAIPDTAEINYVRIRVVP